MACNPDFVQYIADQCAGAGEIAVKKMMGDYCAYCDGVLFGLICDNNFYLKVTEPGKALLKEIILRPPYDGAKDYFYISDVDDRDYLVGLIKATIPALPKPKPKKNPLKLFFYIFLLTRTLRHILSLQADNKSAQLLWVKTS